MRMSDKLENDHPIALSLESLLRGGLKAIEPKIVRALNREEYSEALKLANADYSRLGPTNLNAALTYITLLNFRGLGEESLGILRKTLKHFADAPELQIAQVEALMANEDFEAGIELLVALSELTYQDPKHIAYLGDLFLEVGLDDHALTAYDQALDMGSQDAGVAVNAAQLLLEAGLPHRAAHMLEHAGRLAPSDFDIWNRAGYTWLGLESFEDAVRTYERALKLNDSDAQTWMYCGLAHTRLGQLEEALECYETALDLEPDQAEHWLNVGHCLLELGQPGDALTHYEHAIDLNPDSREAASGMTAAAFELGDIESAESWAERAAELDPGNPDALYNLGVIALTLGRVDEAQEVFDSALEIDPDEPRYKIAIASTLLRRSKIDEAIEAARELLYQSKEDATLLYEFGRDLLRFGGASRLETLLEEAESPDPRWAAIAPVFEFLALALRRSLESHKAAELTTAFVAAVRQYPEIVPVMWDFEELERLGLSVENAHRTTLETMLAILEGRRELEALDAQAA